MNILKMVSRELREWLEFIFIKNIPGKTGVLLRRLYWSGRFKQSSKFTFASGCNISDPKNISLGYGVDFMENCCLYANNNGLIKIGDRMSSNSGVSLNAACDGEIIIGNDVLLGPNVVIRASNHCCERKDIPINKQGHVGGKIVIEDDVWIGANCVILPGVKISKGAVIGAGAVVNKDIPPYALAGGVPAQVLRENFRTLRGY